MRIRNILLITCLLAKVCLTQHIIPEDMKKTLTTPININMDLSVHERYAELNKKYASTLAGLADDILSKA